MNNFGGNWSKIKIEILVDYAKAYLTIMNKYPYLKTIYFDGFAGTGSITHSETEHYIDDTIGAAKRIIEIEKPKSFDIYYFVELDSNKCKLLLENTRDSYPLKKDNIYVVNNDCNIKLIDIANYLRKGENKNKRALLYIDPFGMALDWRSIENLRGLPIDMWILVPTGLGVNRLLIRNGQISEAWKKKLEKFLGIESKEIEDYFYKKYQTLFGDESFKKESDAIKKIAKLYSERLKTVFKYVSKPYELKNSSNSIMYHLFLVTNNKAGFTIANDIVKKYNS